MYDSHRIYLKLKNLTNFCFVNFSATYEFRMKILYIFQDSCVQKNLHENINIYFQFT